MQYNLAVDSGGTKVLAILYDESFCPIRICRVGSMRLNTTPADQVRCHIKALTEQLQLSGRTLSRVSGLWTQELGEALHALCRVEKEVRYGEVDMGLYAAGIKGDGYLALSGTGCGLMSRCGGKFRGTGGYGALVSDEGSGYWIGREAFRAAIHAFEGRGEDTLLWPLIARHFGREPQDMRSAIFSMYDRPEISPAAQVAACAPLVTEAARQGDKVALAILDRAGTLLGDQLLALQRMEGLPKDLPIALSGSVWRGHSSLLSAFARRVEAGGLTGGIAVPEFEPAVGILLGHLFEFRETLTPEDRAFFRTHYKDHLFTLTK